MNPYLVGPPCVFIACPLVSSVVDQLIIKSFKQISQTIYSGGTHSNLGLLPDTNAESGESVRAVVAAANKEVVAVLSGATTIYYNSYLFHMDKSFITLFCCISN